MLVTVVERDHRTVLHRALECTYKYSVSCIINVHEGGCILVFKETFHLVSLLCCIGRLLTVAIYWSLEHLETCTTCICATLPYNILYVISRERKGSRMGPVPSMVPLLLLWTIEKRREKECVSLSFPDLCVCIYFGLAMDVASLWKSVCEREGTHSSPS